MKREFQKITIIKLRKSSEKNLNADLQWFSNSLGLFNERDKEKSCFRVFIALIKASRARREGLTSDEIALRSNISRATVIHHLNRLIESGLVIPHNTKYLLRSDNLEDLVDEIKKDMLRALEDIKSMAEDIDEEIGLKKGKYAKRVISD